jgi:hypothetical protein
LITSEEPPIFLDERVGDIFLLGWGLVSSSANPRLRLRLSHDGSIFDTALEAYDVLLAYGLINAVVRGVDVDVNRVTERGVRAAAIGWEDWFSSNDFW